VHRRGGEEDHVRAEVVGAAAALLTVPARYARLHRDPLADSQRRGAGVDHHAGRLVPEHHRGVHHVVADPAVLVVVHIRATDPDRAHLDDHLVRAGDGHRMFLDAQVADAMENCCEVRLGCHTPRVPRPRRQRHRMG
jgi:hypothetical protein